MKKLNKRGSRSRKSCRSSRTQERKPGRKKAPPGVVHAWENAGREILMRTLRPKPREECCDQSQTLLKSAAAKIGRRSPCQRQAFPHCSRLPWTASRHHKGLEAITNGQSEASAACLPGLCLLVIEKSDAVQRLADLTQASNCIHIHFGIVIAMRRMRRRSCSPYSQRRPIRTSLS